MRPGAKGKVPVGRDRRPAVEYQRASTREGEGN